MLLTVGRSNGISALQLKDQFGPGLQSRAASAAEAPPGDAGRGRDRRGDSGNRDQSRRLALLRGFSELAAIDGRRPSGAQSSGMTRRMFSNLECRGSAFCKHSAHRPGERAFRWNRRSRGRESFGAPLRVGMCPAAGCMHWMPVPEAGAAAPGARQPWSSNRGPGGVSRRRAWPRPRRRPRGRAPRRSCPRLTGSGPLR